MVQNKKIDPRYFVLIFLSSFVITGQLYLGFFQKWDAVLAAVTTTVVTETLIVRIFHKKWRFPLSAFITGLGISLLLSSHLLWPYVLTAFMAISLKFIIRFDGNHIFNPNNVAVVLMLFFLPQFAVSTPKQWTNGFEIMAVILLLGLVAVYFAKRLYVVVSYLAGFAVFAYLRHLIFGMPILLAYGPLLGAAFQLFTFFMITDPRTSPPTWKKGVVFGIAIAFVDAIFRVNKIPNSQFYALFIVTLVMNFPYRKLGIRRAN